MFFLHGGKKLPRADTPLPFMCLVFFPDGCPPFSPFAKKLSRLKCQPGQLRSQQRNIPRYELCAALSAAGLARTVTGSPGFFRRLEDLACALAVIITA